MVKSLIDSCANWGGGGGGGGMYNISNLWGHGSTIYGLTPSSDGDRVTSGTQVVD